MRQTGRGGEGERRREKKRERGKERGREREGERNMSGFRRLSH
jgi:hypothetical protein